MRFNGGPWLSVSIGLTVSTKIQRQFVTLDGRWGSRQVHYRRFGSGPLLLMLHQSPQSSRELVPLMEQWGGDFTIVAPDSPGYGLSDPLDIERAALSDFAAATIEFMDAIGAGRFGVYGFHTGGMIAVALAHGHPDRVTGFACNGVAVPTDQELEEILANYLPPFEPRWDGGHLAWLWAKTREQTIFFPWFDHTLAARMDFPMPSPEHLQNGVCEFLRARHHYHVGYRAAFEFHAERIVPELKVPGLLTASALDPLQAHLERLGDAPDGVNIIASATPADASEHCFAQVRAFPGDDIPAAPATEPMAGRLWHQIVATQAGAVTVQRGGPPRADDAGVPVVVLHGAGGSGASVAFIADKLAKNSNVLVIDLPGHGESDYDPGPGGTTIEACAESVLTVLNKLDLRAVDLVGIEGGACVALEMAGRYPDRTARLALAHPQAFSAEQSAQWRAAGLPSLEPDWAGGHLLRGWHMVRDSRLYFPWFQRDQKGIRWQEPDLDDERLQLEVTEYLKAEGAWQELLRNQLEYPLTEKLIGCPGQVTLCASSVSPWCDATKNLASLTGLPFLDLSNDRETWGTVLADVLTH